MKICFKCKKEKTLSDFYKHSAMADGYLGKCKECARADSEARRAEKEKDPQWVLAERDRHRKKQERYRKLGLAALQNAAERSRRYSEKYPDKARAHALSRHLKPKPCEVCGATEKIERHHPDYGRPKLVRWLCKRHHNELHLKERDARASDKARSKANQ